MTGGADRDVTTLHVRAAATGDAQGLTWLVERFTPLLRAQARYRLFGGAARYCEPDDLVQETWAITLPRLQDLDARDGRMTPVLMKFLSTTLLRCANRVVRKHVLGKPQPAAESAPLRELPADITGVITGLCRRDRACALADAIAQLPEAEREVLVLRGIEQLGNSEVARALGVDASVVTRRFQRALTTLRAQLPGSVFDELD